MIDKNFFFAGGGTGGHIYPAIAVAEQIAKLSPRSKIHFFCSERPIDAHILSQAGFEYTPLPATGLSFRPKQFVRFCRTFRASYKIARDLISVQRAAYSVEQTHDARRATHDESRPVAIGVGGFVAAPVCYAAHRLGVPVNLLNVDIVPGRANRLIARWADEIFVQFEQTGDYLGKAKSKMKVVGCPLRGSFSQPQPQAAIEELGLKQGRKILLITGASSGSANINETICSLLGKLDAFSDTWQIVHLTGKNNFDDVAGRYVSARIGHRVLGYYDDMANLLGAADLVIGRSGAVSVAEYAAAGVPSICMPYPYHKDMHQYLNAGQLVDAGAAVIVDDVPNATDRAEWLWEELQDLMSDDQKRAEMTVNCQAVAQRNAARTIAEALLVSDASCVLRK